MLRCKFIRLNQKFYWIEWFSQTKPNGEYELIVEGDKQTALIESNQFLLTTNFYVKIYEDGIVYQSENGKIENKN